MNLRFGAFLVLLAGAGCEGNVNNDEVLVALTVAASRSSTYVQANAPCREVALSADGRFVVFRSFASTLVPGVTGDQIYRRDLSLGSTLLVSASAAGTAANGSCTDPDVSADGRYVVFTSSATNLHPDDVDATFDVFRKDLSTGAVELVSRATGPAGAKSNGTSFSATVSSDGQRVAFASNATNLDPDDADTTTDVFVRDVGGAPDTILVSRAAGAAGPKGNDASFLPRIAADGDVIAFESVATNLHPDDPDGVSDAFVRELSTFATELVSRESGAAGPKGSGTGPSLSADGRYVTFSTGLDLLGGGDTNGDLDIYVRDRALALTFRASVRADGGEADSVGAATGSRLGRISDDGRTVVFCSDAVNLLDTDLNLAIDYFRKDLSTGELLRVNIPSGGGESAGEPSGGMALSIDVSSQGRWVAFVSEAQDLIDPDANPGSDVFVRGPLR